MQGESLNSSRLAALDSSLGEGAEGVGGGLADIETDWRSIPFDHQPVFGGRNDSMLCLFLDYGGYSDCGGRMITVLKEDDGKAPDIFSSLRRINCISYGK